MAEKEKAKILEREYIIPLRAKRMHVPRFKKTPKSVKIVKEFLAKHMKVPERDLDKVKLDRYVNEYLWARGIKNPPHKIKVKATKEGDIVKVELVEMPTKLKFKKAREDKKKLESEKKAKPKKAEVEKKEETAEKKEITEEKKAEEKENKSAVVEAGEAEEKEEHREEKQDKKITEKLGKQIKTATKR